MSNEVNVPVSGNYDENSIQVLEGLEWGKEERWSEKIDQIRLYSGIAHEMTDMVEAGQICAVTGLGKTYAGEALGCEKEDTISVLEPVL